MKKPKGNLVLTVKTVNDNKYRIFQQEQTYYLYKLNGSEYEYMNKSDSPKKLEQKMI
jgi:hypothetical protein